MAIVTEIIGTGETYTTPALWEAASYNATGADSAVGKVKDNGGQYGFFTINDITPTSIILQPDDGDEHNGTDDFGAAIDRVAIVNVDNVTITGLIFGNLSGDTAWIGIDSNSVSGLINRNIVRDLTVTTDNSLSLSGIEVNLTSGDPCEVVRNIVYGIVQDAVSAGTGIPRGIDRSSSSGDDDIIGNTINNVTNTASSTLGIGIDGGTSGFVINNISTDCDSDFNGSPSESNNLSSDSSAGGAGSLISKLSADQHVSTTAPISLLLKAGADAIDVGSDRGNVNEKIDILGLDVNAEGGLWSMGAHEPVITIVNPTIIARSRWRI